jgi:hypothetical protein
LAWAGDEYCHVGRRRRGTWIKLTKVARGTDRGGTATQGEQGRTTGEGGPTPTQVRASSRPVESTALVQPSLGRGKESAEDPSSSDGGRNPQPQQLGRDASRHGPGSPVTPPVRGSRAYMTARTAPRTHDDPGPRPVVFIRGRRSTPRLRTGPATASNCWAQS